MGARSTSAGVVVLVLLVAAFPGYRAVEAGRRDERAAERRAAETVVGRQLYAANCAECHGDSGEGMDNAPALNSKQFFASANEKLVHHIVEGGVPGTEMPAWWNEFGGPLTDEQIRAIVTYVLMWVKNAPDRPDWRAPGS
ncbi:MAG: cytochrome c [Acidobacteria bacterium]|nr:cytochrome c [Acidobacteriota bacterium]